MDPVFDRMSIHDAEAMCTWTYPPPYDVYNVDPEKKNDHIAYMIDPGNRFIVMRAGDETCGFFSLGKDGQVTGGDYRDDALDIGMGMKPEYTGKGKGGLVRIPSGRIRIERVSASTDESDDSVV